MMTIHRTPSRTPPRTAMRTPVLTALAAACLLSACGGGDSPEASAPPVTPTFQLAQALPPVPDDVDADGSNASALRAPGRVAVETVAGDGRQQILAATGNGEGGRVTISAAATSSVYYTPAQVRSAYGLDAWPAGTAANKGAWQGSGQTIAIVGAFHNADIANELAAFSQKFGLPACAVLSIPASSVLPLAKPAAGSGCTISTVFATATAGLAARAPGLNAGWKTESSLDVEWAHAIAPLARIILVEAATPNGDDLIGAIQLAARLGASVVSMSFGGIENSSTTALDRAFQTSGVTYVASTGDSGRGVSWPAVSSQVLAVGGTSLSANGSTRSETAWSKSGGGISAYVAAPAWQSGVKVTATTGVVSAPTRRTVPDVAFNGDPNTGQLTYVTTLTSGSGWVIAGGTSLSTPQWAGLVAVANAVRAASGKPVLGPVNAGLYRTIGGVSATYASTMLDVKTGSNGSCKGCAAVAGYDLVTGFGTPNAGKLLDKLVGL